MVDQKVWWDSINIFFSGCPRILMRGYSEERGGERRKEEETVEIGNNDVVG